MGQITIPVKNDSVTEIYVYVGEDVPKTYWDEKKSRTVIYSGQDVPNEELTPLSNAVSFKFMDKKRILTFSRDFQNIEDVITRYGKTLDYGHPHLDFSWYGPTIQVWRDIIKENPEVAETLKKVQKERDKNIKYCADDFCREEFWKYGLNRSHSATDDHPLIEYIKEIQERKDLKFMRGWGNDVFHPAKMNEYIERIFMTYFSDKRFNEIDGMVKKGYFDEEIENIVEKALKREMKQVSMSYEDEYLFQHTNLHGKLAIANRLEFGSEKKTVKDIADSIKEKFSGLLNMRNKNYVKYVDPNKPKISYVDISDFAIPENEFTWGVKKDFEISYNGKTIKLEPGYRIDIGYNHSDRFIKEVEEKYYDKEQLKYGKFEISDYYRDIIVPPQLQWLWRTHDDWPGWDNDNGKTR